MSAREQIPMKQAAASARVEKPAPFGTLQRECSCGGSGGGCEECKKKKTLQRYARGNNAPATIPPIVDEVLRSPGRPLDANTRSIFEPRFGHDFSKVCIHTDSQAARSAQAVQAHAYTVGREIVFGAAQYAPGTTAGNSLLAHELTHVVQQGQGAQGAGSARSISSPTDAAEREAESIGRASLGGKFAPTQTASPGGLFRLGANANCTTDQANSIHAGITEAQGWLTRAIPKLGQSPLSAAVLASLRNNFGATYGVAANAAAIQSKLSTVNGKLGVNPYSCATPATDALCSSHCGDSGAGSNASTICSNLTLKPGGDTVFRTGCVLHETFHAAFSDFTIDSYSGWNGHSSSTRGYPGTTPEKNADSYTQLTMDLS